MIIWKEEVANCYFPGVPVYYEMMKKKGWAICHHITTVIAKLYEKISYDVRELLV
jgi:hypothetical protein